MTANDGGEMTADEVLEALPTGAWDGPFLPALQRHAVDALEAGRVLVLPALRFAVADAEHRFLDPASLGGSRKNISLDPGLRPSGQQLPWRRRTPRRWPP